MTGLEADLLVPIKSLFRAKTRLRGAAGDSVADPGSHARLTLALSRDTIAAARTAPGVHRVIAVTSDPEVTEVLTADGVPVLADRPGHDLNGALAYGAEVLRAGGAPRAVGALQADLPALRAEELAEALANAQDTFRTGRATRAFCADSHGEGTTLLVCAPWAQLEPRFGIGSAVAHQRSGALRLTGDWPGLRQDVDTPDDLWQAARLGLGAATAAVLRNVARPRG